MSKDVLRCDSLQFSLHNLQISLSLCSKITAEEAERLLKAIGG